MNTPTSTTLSIQTGRRHKALLVVGILLIAANLRASVTSVTPLLGEVRADLDLSAPEASALISVPLMTFAAFSPIAPRLARRLGMERLLGLALAVLAVGIVARSLPWGPALWIGTVALGLAIATGNVILPSLIKRDFPREVGRFTGLYSSVQGATAAIASGIAVPVAGVAPGGWRLAFGIWAGLALIALAVFSPQLRQRTIPDDQLVTPDTASGRDRSPWSTATGWWVTIVMGMQSTVFYTSLTWWPSIDQSHGASAATAGLHQVVLQVFTLLGSLASAAVLHHYQRDQRVIGIIIAALLFVAIAGELVLPALSVVWLACIGFGTVSSLVLVLSLCGFRTRDHHQAASLSGMAQSIGYVLAALGPIAAGLLHEWTGSWTVPLLMLLALTLIQAVAGYFAGRDRVI